MIIDFNFDYTEDIGPSDANHLKCLRCGLEIVENHDIKYDDQSDCPNKDGGQMMSWDWCGWKSNETRTERLRQEDEEIKRKRLEPVSQETEDFSEFSEEELTLECGLVVNKSGTTAPWLGAFGACLIKIYGVRHNADTGRVEFGIGNEKPPILGWVEVSDFFEEWPQ